MYRSCQKTQKAQKRTTASITRAQVLTQGLSSIRRPICFSLKRKRPSVFETSKVTCRTHLLTMELTTALPAVVIFRRAASVNGDRYSYIVLLILKDETSVDAASEEHEEDVHSSDAFLRDEPNKSLRISNPKARFIHFGQHSG